MVKSSRIKTLLGKLYIYGVLLLMYLPILVLMVFSFSTSDTLGNFDEGFSFDLYVRLFKNQALMTAVGNTLLIAFVAATISTILGTLGAVGVFYSKVKTRKTVETMTQLPVVNAEIVMALSLAVVFKTLNTS